MADVKKLIHKLAERTDDGLVQWQTAKERDTFAASFDNLSVLIGAPSVTRRLLAPRSQWSPPHSLRFAIVDDKGDAIVAVEGDRISGWTYRLLDPLYQAARLSAMGDDWRLDRLLEILESAPESVAAPND